MFLVILLTITMVEGSFEEPMERESLQKLWQKYKVDIALYSHVHKYERTCPIYQKFKMNESMIKFQQNLIESEFEAENLLLAKNQIIENDKARNGNREALTALRKIAKTTKTSVSTPFESLMKEMEGTGSRSLVKEVCPTCGDHDPKENTWMMFPGTGVFTRIPFHAAHTILEEDQSNLDYDTKKLQSYVKDKSLWISEKGYIADKISPSVVRSMVTLTDKSK